MAVKLSKFYRFAAGLIAAVFVMLTFADVTVLAAPTVKSESVVVINKLTGEILYEKNCDKKMYPASTTKLMTGLLGAEKGVMTQYVTMSYNSIWGFDRDSSHIALDVNEEVRFEQLMYGLMLASGNECAMGIAETIAGSTDAFVKMMNDRARELGATGTHFANPHGLHDEAHYTTARDMALIARAAISNAKLLEIMCTTQYTIPPTNKQPKERVFNNTHKMLSGREYYYEGVVCGKTGWTPDAGNCLVTYAKRNGIELIVAVFGGQSAAGCCTDTANLLDYFFENYEMRSFSVKKYMGAELESIELDVAGTVKAECSSTFSVLFEKHVDVGEVNCIILPDNTLTLPIEKGTQIATVGFSLEGRLLGELPVYAAETMYVPSFAEIPDNIPQNEGKSIFDADDKSGFVKFIIVLGYIILVLVILAIILILALLCIRQQNMRKLQRRRMSRRMSGAIKPKERSDTPYGRKK